LAIDHAAHPVRHRCTVLWEEEVNGFIFAEPLVPDSVSSGASDLFSKPGVIGFLVVLLILAFFWRKHG
jgi:hypothetical protein